MKIQLIRHSTIIISTNNKTILVDPVLSEANSLSPIEGVPNQNKNPLTPLPMAIDYITNCDAVLITHTHMDHFDNAAINSLSKDIPIFCQPDDKSKLENYNFTNVHSIQDNYTWNDITINRTSGMHGYGELAKELGPVSGFVISSQHEKTIYIAGDTVWCTEVKKSIEKFKPNVIVCNCGCAQFSFGKPITMTTSDIYEISKRYPDLKIVAVHMDAWNHCRLSRKDLRNYIKANKFNNYIAVPEDGESLVF